MTSPEDLEGLLSAALRSRPSFSLVAYLAERFPARIFLPLSCLLIAPGLIAEVETGRLRAASWTGWWTSWGASGALRWALSLGLLCALRLWDDLADREHDRALHPERLVVRAAPAPAWRRVVGLLLCALAGLASLPAPGLRLSAALLLGGLLAAWYRWRPLGRRQLNAALVLLKYPALIALLWPLAPRPALAGSVAMGYGAALSYELAHDAALRRQGPPWLAALALLWLGVSLAAFALEAP